MQTRVDFAERIHLRCRQAFFSIFTSLALNRCRIEMALEGVVENTVGHSVELVAGCEHSVGNGGYLCLGNEAGWSRGECLCVYDRQGKQACPVVSGRAGEDAVV